MTDAELIALLQQKTPRELTPQEIALLRERWPQSAELRQALLEHLQLETELTAGLSTVSLSVEVLLERAARQRTAGSRTRPWGVWGVVGLVVMMALGSWWWWRTHPPAKIPAPEELATATAESQPSQPSALSERHAAAASAAAGDVVSVPEQPAELPSSSAPDKEPAPARDLPAETPWRPWLADTARPLPLDSPQALGDLRQMGHDELPVEEFRRWWAEVPGQSCQWHQSVLNGKRTLQFQGTARLQAPWLADTCLRLTPFDVQEFSLTFWTGNRGVHLQFYRQREPHLWAALAVERKPGERAPQLIGLLSTDSGAVYRSGVSTWEFQYREGSLVLAVAHTPVLEVPLAELPDEVWLQGQFRLRGASWVRMEPLPRRIESESELTWSSAQGAESTWTWEPATASSLEATNDGTLTFWSQPSSVPVSAVHRLPEPGFYEVLVQFQRGDIGTGVVLGDAAGKPLVCVGLLRDRRTQQLTWAAWRPHEARSESDYDPRAMPPPYYQPGTWLRLVAGWGMLQVCVSADGRQWGHVVETPLRDVRGGVQAVGLFAQPGESPRQLVLRRLEVRRLRGLEAVVEPSLRTLVQLDAANLPRDLTLWQQKSLSSRPGAVSAAEWWNAWALATLQAGPPPELVAPLVDRLLATAEQRPWPLEQLWQVYYDTLKLADAWGEREAAAWMARFAASARQRETLRWQHPEQAWNAWLQAPLWTNAAVRDDFHRAFAYGLLEAVEQGDTLLVDRLSRLALHVVTPAHPDHQPRDLARQLEQLARWARGFTGDSTPVPRDQVEEVFPVAWRHPFSPPLDKDGYNNFIELRAALDSGAYRDAARMTLALGAYEPGGLLPDARDPRLFLTLPVALEDMWRETPAFAQALRDENTATGWLRVRQAQQRNAAEAMQLLTLQCFGTPAAAAAHRWLGDRSLAVGDFASAWRAYERAWLFATPEQQQELEPLKIFARAFTGPLPGDTPAPAAASTAPLVIAGQDLAPVVEERRKVPFTHGEDALAALPPPLSPQRYRLEPKARFDGQAGHNAGQGEFRHTDAFGRQFGVAVDARQVYVSNRFQVTAYDRTTGQARWAVAAGSEQGSAHAHRFTPMTPLVVNETLFVRRLTKAGIELACLDAHSGVVRWHLRPGDRGQWISDPIWTPAGLRVLAAHRGDDETLDVRWTLLQPETGQLLAENPLYRLRDAWQGEVPCRLAAKGWNVVACVGGTVACFGLDGALQWVRQAVWCPPKLDPLSDDHYVSVPLISERDVLVSLPGSRSVECLDLSTGRRLWNYIAADLQGLLGATSQRVVLRGLRSVTVCDRATGRVLWQRELDQALTAWTASADYVVVCRVLPQRAQRGWLQVVWWDAGTGAEVAEMPVDAEPREDWRFGPWFTVDQQLWAFAGQTWRDPHRDLVTVVPLPNSEAGPWDQAELAAWQSPLNHEERRLAQMVLPGWSPMVAGKDVLSLASGEVHGRSPVLVSRLKKEGVLQFLRHVHLPEHKTTSLFLRVGHQPRQRWQLQVRIDAQLVVDRTVDESNSQQGWVEHSISLGPSTGRSVLVEVSQHNLDNQSTEGLWHRLAIETH